MASQNLSSENLDYIESLYSIYKRNPDELDEGWRSFFSGVDFATDKGGISSKELNVYNLIQASEFYPENAEIEFRLAGLYYMLLETEKGSYHLKNGLRFNAEYAFIIEELFPSIYKSQPVISLLKAKL